MLATWSVHFATSPQHDHSFSTSQVMQQQPEACAVTLFDSLQHLTTSILSTPVPEPLVARRRTPASQPKSGEAVYQMAAAKL